MKILIIGSMAFVKDMVLVKKALNKLGHSASLPHDSDPHLKDGTLVESLSENLKFCIANNTMKRNFDLVAEH